MCVHNVKVYRCLCSKQRYQDSKTFFVNKDIFLPGLGVNIKTEYVRDLASKTLMFIFLTTVLCTVYIVHSVQ